ncbi:glycosyltransferase [Candidatus Fermentibacteria bacterium]|nr:glycosyltransferase [Candidatus Fermentibacteria bacterium]
MILSIIIPTFNRRPILMRGLKEIAGQCQRGDAEVVVVDDGSVDDTVASVELWARESPVPVRMIRQDHRGPATARNRGLAAAHGRLVLFMGDDVVAAPGLVEAHLAHHHRFPGEDVAVLGRVTWSRELHISPLMHWLEHGGPQFCYDKITDPMNVPPVFFWTANISVARSFVCEAGGFSERFPGAAFEDVELGARLGQRGMRFHYEPAAVGYHHHPVTLRGSLARMESLAQGALIADATIPGLITLGRDTPWARARRALAHSRPVLAVVEAWAPVCTAVPALRAPYFRFVHDLFYRAALRRLIQETRWSPS